MIDIFPISSPADLDVAFAIRRQVFVEEQSVAAEEEYDEFETTSTHFLARIDTVPCGTARWRRTSNGVKLERFAVLKAYRKKGVAKALVQAVLNDVFSQQPEPIERIYLHAQVTAMPLYAGFGFVPVGPLFDEAGIQHQKMVLPGSAYLTQ
jgi:predicted GNAT family N-acyltransferase